MRKNTSPGKVALLLFLAVFSLNTAFMYVGFGINIFNPLGHKGAQVSSGGTRKGISRAGYNPQWKPAAEEQSGSEGGNTGSGAGFGTGSNGTGIAGSSSGGTTGSGSLDSTGGDATGNGSAGKGSKTGNGCVTGSRGYYLTTEQVAALEGIDVRDKLTAVSALSKLGRQKSDQIYDMALDGVTHDEYGKILTMLSSILTGEEIEDLKKIVEGVKNKPGQ